MRGKTWRICSPGGKDQRICSWEEEAKYVLMTIAKFQSQECKYVETIGRKTSQSVMVFGLLKSYRRSSFGSSRMFKHFFHMLLEALNSKTVRFLIFGAEVACVPAALAWGGSNTFSICHWKLETLKVLDSWSLEVACVQAARARGCSNTLMMMGIRKHWQFLSLKL